MISIRKTMLTSAVIALALAGICGNAGWTAETDLHQRVEHGYAENDGVKIHYVTLGKGPLLVLLHGFPDYWYTWREQMVPLSESYRVAALDLRGYNRSDKPAGVAQYSMSLLVADVEAVIRHLGEERAVIVGHDWGGAIAWQFAMNRQEMTDKLVILNVPHPGGMRRELTENETQKNNSQYARNFQKEGAHRSLTAEGLAGWVKDKDARSKYVEAFRRSDFEAMLHYYKANYPKTTGSSDAAASPPTFAKIKAPVLILHGLDDPYLLAAGHNSCWEWLESDMTLVTIPGAGHFVQQDAPDLVNRSLLSWLKR